MATSSALILAALLLLLLQLAFDFTNATKTSEKPLNSGKEKWSRGQRCRSKNDGNNIDNVTLYIALKVSSESLSHLEETFWQVSDPEHERFRKFLSNGEISQILNVSNLTRDRVVNFLGATSLDRSIFVSPTGDIVKASIGCKRIEKLFNIEMHEYNHSLTGAIIIRSRNLYTVPAEIRPFVRHIAGINDFPMRRTLRAVGRRKAAVSEITNMILDNQWSDCNGSCKGNIVPSVLREQYGIPSQVIQEENILRARGNFAGRSKPARVDTGMAVAEFSSNWCQEGLDRFKADCGLETNLTVDNMVGSNSPGVCRSRHGGYSCAEAMLDITYIKALASNVRLTDIYQGGHFSIQEWAMELSKMSDDELPLVHSISFGEDETELGSVGYMDACNVEFQKLGLRGVSLLFASGDQGVWGRTGYNRKMFSPDFPSSSPYVTSIGGTTLATVGVVGAERSWDSSGGGFSNVFVQPPFQEKMVSAYLSSASLPDQKYWNRTGRAYPDVSALAGGQNGYCVSVSGDDFNGFTGTSASTPVWSAVVALLNSIRLARGDTPLGFLNPVLYSNPSAFTDIVSGSNDAGTGIGFNASKGYDPCTGLGTIDYNKLAGILL